jgi:glycosyltransferase involved in cell wall biosynthesis
MGWETTLGLTKGAKFDDPTKYQAVHSGLNAIEIDGTLGTRQHRVHSIANVIRKHQPDIVFSMRVFDVIEASHYLKSSQSSQVLRLMWGVRAFEAPFIHDAQTYHKNIDYFVTSGELIAETLQRYSGVDRNRIESIGGGIASPLQPVTPRDLTRQPLRILYAGRLEQPQKRARDIVSLVGELKQRQVNFQLDVCGAGPEEESLKQALRSEIVTDAIRFHGWVSQEELYRNFYPHSDIFLHTAAWEGITISPREAMAHGMIPVISEFRGIHAEGQFLHGVNSLIFPVGEMQSAAESILRLIRQPELAVRLSENAIRSQTGKYSFEGALLAWRDALNKCLSLPSQTGDARFPEEKIDGRLTRWGVPASWQSRLRTCLKIPVKHAEPGSEWPTHSGTLTDAAQNIITKLADQIEDEQRSARRSCP